MIQHLAAEHGLRPVGHMQYDSSDWRLELEPIPNFKPRVIQRVPSTIEGRYRWLRPIFERLFKTEDYRRELETLPGRFKKAGLYIRNNLNRVEKTRNLARVRRLKSPKLQARMVAASLADLARGPAYAIQKSEMD